MTLSRRQFLLSASVFVGEAILPGSAMPQPLPNGTYALTGTVLPGDGTALADHAVIVSGSTISEVVPARALHGAIPVIAQGGWIMPGIINGHVHRSHTGTQRRDRFLNHGVTSIGDLGSPLGVLSVLCEDTGPPTATAACTGPVLCAPGGYPIPVHGAEYATPVTSSAQARDTVKRIADLGATMVKIAFEPGPNTIPWPTLSPAIAQAVCDQARILGLIVRCHVENLDGVAPAIDAGVDVIDHVPHVRRVEGRLRSVLEPDGKTPVLAYRKLLGRMAREDIMLMPTLDVLSRSPFDGPALYEPVRHFHRLGGRVGVGNDYPYRRTDAGMPLMEMALLKETGMTESAILTAATAWNARACALKTRGRLEPGMKADIIVTRDDPTLDFSTLAAPTRILKDGKRP